MASGFCECWSGCPSFRSTQWCEVRLVMSKRCPPTFARCHSLTRTCLRQGIPVGARNQFVALNSLGQWQLSWYCNSRRYCSAQAVVNWMRRACGAEWDQQQSPFLLGNGNVKSGRIADEPPGHLHIEDPFSQGFNIARNSWKWMHAISLFQVRAEHAVADVSVLRGAAVSCCGAPVTRRVELRALCRGRTSSWRRGAPRRRPRARRRPFGRWRST